MNCAAAILQGLRVTLLSSSPARSAGAWGLLGTNGRTWDGLIFSWTRTVCGIFAFYGSWAIILLAFGVEVFGLRIEVTE